MEEKFISYVCILIWYYSPIPTYRHMSTSFTSKDLDSHFTKGR